MAARNNYNAEKVPCADCGKLVGRGYLAGGGYTHKTPHKCKDADRQRHAAQPQAQARRAE